MQKSYCCICCHFQTNYCRSNCALASLRSDCNLNLHSGSLGSWGWSSHWRRSSNYCCEETSRLPGFHEMVETADKLNQPRLNHGKWVLVSNQARSSFTTIISACNEATRASRSCLSKVNNGTFSVASNFKRSVSCLRRQQFVN